MQRLIKKGMANKIIIKFFELFIVKITLAFLKYYIDLKFFIIWTKMSN